MTTPTSTATAISPLDSQSLLLLTDDDLLCTESLEGFDELDHACAFLSIPHPEEDAVNLEYLTQPNNDDEDFFSCLYGSGDWTDVPQEDNLCTLPAKTLLEDVALLSAERKREWVQGLEDVEGGSPLKRLRLRGYEEDGQWAGMGEEVVTVVST